MATPHVPESLMPRTKRWGLSMKVVTREDCLLLPKGEKIAKLLKL